MSSVAFPRADERFGDDAGGVQISFLPDRSRLTLTGEVDARLNAELARATTLLAERGLTVDIETCELSFIDSSVIALVAHLANRLHARVRFLAPTPQVRFLLDLTQVGELVDIVEPELPLSPGDREADPAVAEATAIASEAGAAAAAGTNVVDVVRAGSLVSPENASGALPGAAPVVLSPDEVAAAGPELSST